MTSTSPNNRRRGASFTKKIEKDPAHHLAGPFLPQTPRSLTPVPEFQCPRSNVSSLLQWAVQPMEAFKILVVPLVLYITWQLLAPWTASLETIVAPYLGNYPASSASVSNPFRVFFLLSHYVPTSDPDDPRYQKGHLDIVFVVYYIFFWSMFRQINTVNLARPIARYFGIRKEAKMDRFGEQWYALVYFTIMGSWGYRVMSQLPTYWYHSDNFFLGYPHWDMTPELKRYYLMQMAYWCQQLLVLILGLEKPRKDYYELIAHHVVTIWLIGWSYLTNMTLIGNAVYMSMDIPDAALALAKLLNYMQWERAKTVAFAVLIVLWTYFRHILNLKMMWGIWFGYFLMPQEARVWNVAKGYWMPAWMRYQMFAPLLFLQCLNLFWYFLLMRILVRSLLTSKIDDERSDEEDEGTTEKEE